MSSHLPSQMLQRSFVKTVLRRLIALIAVIGLIYALIAIIYATQIIFKVKMNYAVILDRFDGSRQAITEVGWHARAPFFTSIEQVVPLMNQSMQFGGTPKPMRIISKGNVALWTSGVLTYRILNLHTWAIENLHPLELLQGDYDGIVRDILQGERVDQLISDRDAIKDKIFNALKSQPINVGGPTIEQKYGIEVVSFVLNETRFGDKLVAASEEKKRRELLAEADNYAADQEASRIRKLYAAYLAGIKNLQNALGHKTASNDTALLEFLTQQKWATAYEQHQNGQSTVVIQNTGGSPPAITLPALKDAEQSAGGKNDQTAD